MLLKFLISIINAELFKWIIFKYLKAKNIQNTYHSYCFLICKYILTKTCLTIYWSISVIPIQKGVIFTNEKLPDSDDISQNVIRSAVAVPMKFRDKLVGVLYHDNRVFMNPFQKSDLELLEHFSTIAAITMDNLTAYEEIQKLNERLREEKQYYEEQQLESLHFEEFVGKSKPIKKVYMLALFLQNHFKRLF